MEYRDKRNRRNPGSSNVYLICSGAQRQHACVNKHHYTYSKTVALVLDWVTDIQIPNEKTNHAGVANMLLRKLAERDDLKRRVREALEKWETVTIPLIKDELLKSAERNAKGLQDVEREIGELQRAVETTKHGVLNERRASVSRARAELTELDGEALFEARAKLAAGLRQVIDHIEFEAGDRFTVFLNGSVKAYRFAEGKFSHAIDVRSSSWVRFPTALQKKEMGAL